MSIPSPLQAISMALLEDLVQEEDFMVGAQDSQAEKLRWDSHTELLFNSNNSNGSSCGGPVVEVRKTR